jgi:hypothetical protein
MEKESFKMGSTESILAALIRQDLFSELNKTKCGPSHAFEAYHPKVNWRGIGYNNYPTSLVAGAPNIIPDVGYHPKIMVTIDFTHQFTLSEETPTGEGVDGRRPVDPRMLQKIGENLLSFYSYFFEYVLSKGKKYKLSRLKNLVEKARNMDEHALNLFINQMINFFITDVNVERSRLDIGSATITMRDPPNRKTDGKYNLFFDKTYDILNQLFVPMLPITIWARGRLYKDWYLPIFDGFLVAATSTNTEGFLSATLACKDLLELTRISHEMINPAIVKLEEIKNQDHVNLYSKPLYGHDHFSIFKTMFKGGKLAFDPDNLTTSIVVDPSEKGTHNFSQIEDFEEVNEDSVVKPEDLDNQYRGLYTSVGGVGGFSLETALQLTSHTHRRRKIVSWGASITPYRLLQFATPAPFSSEFSSRLDILREVSGMVYYDLYVDAWGNVNYHPMRFGNLFLAHDIYTLDKKQKERIHEHTFPGSQVISPEELLNSSSLFNSEEMVTFLRFSGLNAFIPGTAPELVDLVRSSTDEDLMARFGYRRREVNNPLFNNTAKIPDKQGGDGDLLQLASDELLKYMNGELYTYQASIIFRPELDLALPLLVLPENNVFYINTISHSISIGGDASTTINGSFGRRADEPAIDLANYILETQKLYTVNTEETVESLPLRENQEFIKRWRKQQDEAAIATTVVEEGRQQEKTRRNSRASNRRANQKNTKDAANKKKSEEFARKVNEGITAGQWFSKYTE